MKTTLKTGKKIIHSDWALMQSHFNNDCTFELNLADKNSNDQIKFELEKDDIERLCSALKLTLNSTDSK